MAEGVPIKVTLKRIQILDTLDPGHKEHGDFVFRAKVSSQNQGGMEQETRFPEGEGVSWKISSHPRKNRVSVNKVIFDGAVDDHLVVELDGEELDRFTASEHLDHYEREFSGSPESWFGIHGPDAEEGGDPEDMSTWRVWYEISPG